jgi:hypothetical protein
MHYEKTVASHYGNRSSGHTRRDSSSAGVQGFTGHLGSEESACVTLAFPIV